MTFSFFFSGGPLDGMIVDGDSGELPRNCYDFGTVAFRDSNRATVGATFEAFNPLLIADVPPRSPVQLHTYRVTTTEPFSVGYGAVVVPVHLEIYATHVGPSDRTIAPTFDAIVPRAAG